MNASLHPSGMTKAQRRNARRSRNRLSARKSRGEGDFSSSPSSSVEDTKKNQQRTKIIEEIISSEEKYLQDMYVLILYYVTPIRSGRFPEVSSNGDVSLLFDGNTALLEVLKAEVQKPTPMIGEIFQSRAGDICQYYGVFCNHQTKAMAAVHAALQSNGTFKDFEENSKLRPEVQGLGLLDYLVKPFQRLLKYPLFLRELREATPESHPDYEGLGKALGTFGKEVEGINAQKASHDNLKKMVELNQSLLGLPRAFQLMIPTRHCVYEGSHIRGPDLRDVNENLWDTRSRTVLCALQRLFVVRQEEKSGEISLPGHYLSAQRYFPLVGLTEVHVESLDELRFQLYRSDKNLTYILYGKTPQEKEIWLREIRGQQKHLNPSSVGTLRGTLRSSPAETKEFIRVFVSKETFKTVAVTSDSTAREVTNEVLRKVQLNSSEPSLSYRIAVLVQGKERVLEEEEKPWEVQQTLAKQKLKLGDTNHFKLIATPASRAERASTTRHVTSTNLSPSHSRSATTLSPPPSLGNSQTSPPRSPLPPTRPARPYPSIHSGGRP